MALAGLLVGACTSKASKSSTSSGGRSRGFDGKTITVSGLGPAGQFADADIGAKARIKRANDTNELKGIKIKYLGLADDKLDPAVATTEARRLVTQEKVFAIVPAVSPVSPGQYLNAQHVPYVGWGIDGTFCSKTPSTSLYGFGYSGCSVPQDPPVMADIATPIYKYVKQKSGKDHPTMAMFSNDDASGKTATRLNKVPMEGAGFKVVYAKPSVPLTVSDYSPYVKEFMSSDGGDPPDTMACLLAVQCVPIWQALKAAGFKGVFWSPLYTDFLLQPLAGTIATSFYNPAPSPTLTRVEKDLSAVKPGQKIALGSAAGYFGADMFIQAVKQVQKSGDAITPENVQKVLAHQTWEIKGLAGPIKYPESTVVTTPACGALNIDENGTAWKIIEPYKCSSKRFKVQG